MAEEAIKPAEVEPPHILEICRKNVRMRCPEELDFLFKNLRSSEYITIGPEKIGYQGLRSIIVPSIPIELRARLLTTKGPEKQKVRREIVRLEKAQKKEVSIFKRIHDCIYAIQKAINDGCAIVCTREDIQIVPLSRSLKV